MGECADRVWVGRTLDRQVVDSHSRGIDLWQSFVCCCRYGQNKMIRILKSFPFAIKSRSPNKIIHHLAILSRWQEIWENPMNCDVNGGQCGSQTQMVNYAVRAFG
jgi:hypothetical protein